MQGCGLAATMVKIKYWNITDSNFNLNMVEIYFPAFSVQSSVCHVIVFANTQDDAHSSLWTATGG